MLPRDDVFGSQGAESGIAFSKSSGENAGISLASSNEANIREGNISNFSRYYFPGQFPPGLGAPQSSSTALHTFQAPRFSFPTFPQLNRQFENLQPVLNCHTRLSAEVFSHLSGQQSVATTLGNPNPLLGQLVPSRLAQQGRPIPNAASWFLGSQTTFNSSAMSRLSPTDGSASSRHRTNLYGIDGLNFASRSSDGFPLDLPFLIALPEDKEQLSAHQVFLRQQIEVFRATEDDVLTHTRGRNKPISLGQIGIRCRHCAHLPVAKRQKGSTYFPSAVIGLYQAAQNMSTTHMQCGLCSAMPNQIKLLFANLISTKVAGSGAGRPYWGRAAKRLGLVDADNGIRFIRDSCPDPKPRDEEDAKCS